MPKGTGFNQFTNKSRRTMIYLLIVITILLIGVGILLMVFYPRLKIASGYAAKYVASHSALSNLSKDRIANALNFFPVKYFTTHVDPNKKKASASLYGLAQQSAFLYKTGPSAGAIMGSHDFDLFSPVQAPSRSDRLKEPWPIGDNVNIDSDDRISARVQEVVERYLKKDIGIHAITVANKSKLLGEAYNDGVDPTSRLLGWSMTKTIANALFGILHRQGKLNVTDKAPIPEWSQDERRNITIKDLLQMQSGLKWSEDYGNISDVTRMLYREADCFASSVDNPLESAVSGGEGKGGKTSLVTPGSVFNYASGTSNILSGIIRKYVDSHDAYLHFPHKELFEPLGMHSAIIEVDKAGNYILSSYGWATARDWTRFGLLYLNKGTWNGKEIFSEDWYQQSVTPADKSDGEYGYHIWLNARKKDGTTRLKGVPEDAFFEDGVFGQRILVIPSEDLVITLLCGRMDDKVYETFFDGFYPDIIRAASQKN